MTIRDTMNRVYREHARYTGDGKPNEPTGAPLPIGDPQSGVHSPKKSELREAFGEAGDVVQGAREVAETALGMFLGQLASDPPAGYDGAPLVGGEWYVRPDGTQRVYSSVAGWGNAPQGPPGASGVDQDYPSAAFVEIATVPLSVVHFRTAGFATNGDGGGALYRRVGSEPSHAFKVQSDDGAWWEVATDRVTPQMVGHFPNSASFNLQTLLTALEPTSYGELFLSDDDWYASNIFVGQRIRITGPGTGRLTVLDTWVNTGEAHSVARNGNPRSHQQATALRMGDASPVRQYAVGVRNAALSIVNIAFTEISFNADGFDTMGGFRTAGLGGLFQAPGASRTAIYVPAGARQVQVSGFVHFASGAGSLRAVVIYRNATLLHQFNVSPVAGGFGTTVPFSIAASCEFGDSFSMEVYQDSGGLLNVVQARLSVEVIARDSFDVPGKRLKIFQGDWNALEASYAGGYTDMIRELAAYDVLALSHIEAIGVAPYPIWNGTSPELITPSGPFTNIIDSGYQKLKRVIYDVKALNPKCLIFGYVSAAIDAPLWSAGGNPAKVGSSGDPGAFEQPVGSGNWYVNDNTWDPILYANVTQWMNLCLRDPNLPIDGYFFDHFVSSFMSSTVRDTTVSIAKARGMKVMVNITSAGAANVQWAAACPYLTHGDYLCLEGFFIDNGVDVFTETNNTITEMQKLAARGIWLAAVNEEAASTPIDIGSVNNINGRALFNSFYVPGWCYEYNRVSYDVVGPPGI